MFNDLVRIKNKIKDKEKIEKIIKETDYGVLSTICKNGYPYGVPLNYTYYDNNIYLHSAKRGLKIENFKNNDKASFSIVGYKEIIPEKFNTFYESVIIFGTISEITEIEDKKDILLSFINKYSSNFLSKGYDYVNKAYKGPSVYKLKIEHITGKSNKK